jgi:hypothetical protein
MVVKESKFSFDGSEGRRKILMALREALKFSMALKESAQITNRALNTQIRTASSYKLLFDSLDLALQMRKARVPGTLLLSHPTASGAQPCWPRSLGCHTGHKILL